MRITHLLKLIFVGPDKKEKTEDLLDNQSAELIVEESEAEDEIIDSKVPTDADAKGPEMDIDSIPENASVILVQTFDLVPKIGITNNGMYLEYQFVDENNQLVTIEVVEEDQVEEEIIEDIEEQPISVEVVVEAEEQKPETPNVEEFILANDNDVEDELDELRPVVTTKATTARKPKKIIQMKDNIKIDNASLNALKNKAVNDNDAISQKLNNLNNQLDYQFDYFDLAKITEIEK